ncbi:MAG: polyprenyl synthetase family protein [Phycisphaerae bacterium]|nr:polyprenyl synthetase family protein [Gemmatimonadaceae bacterium]
MTAEDAQLKVMALHLIRRGGKRLRPALLMLCGTYGESRDQQLLQAAAALELMHVASLYHDDIMDRAPMRRGGVSTNARWGSPQAAFAGTWLFARACELWASFGAVPNELTSRMAVDLCRGQLNEMEHAFDTDAHEATHLNIIALKTGSLFALPCRLGAVLGGCSDQVTDALTRYGVALGLAFQLADDLLDLTADTAQIGKLAGKDLREGIYSLAVLHALRSPHESPALRDLLDRVAMGDDEVQQALGLLRESGAVDYARQRATQHAEDARAALTTLPPGDARDSLHALTYLAVNRVS